MTVSCAQDALETKLLVLSTVDIYLIVSARTRPLYGIAVRPLSGLRDPTAGGGARGSLLAAECRRFDFLSFSLFAVRRLTHALPENAFRSNETIIAYNAPALAPNERWKRD